MVFAIVPYDIEDMESRHHQAGIEGTYAKNDSKIASASLNTSFVSFERWSSSCRVIRAGILTSYANISK